MKNKKYTVQEFQNATSFIIELFETNEITIRHWNVYCNMLEVTNDNIMNYSENEQDQLIYNLSRFDRYLDKVEFKMDLRKNMSKISTLN
jgi:predicted transcriptional regulator